MRHLARALCLALLAASLAPGARAEEPPSDDPKVLGERFLEALKFDEAHLGETTYAITREGAEIGTYKVTVSKVKYRGKPEYKVVSRTSIAMQGFSYTGESEARITAQLTVRKAAGAVVQRGYGDRDVKYQVQAGKTSVGWIGTMKGSAPSKESFEPADQSLGHLGLAFPRALVKLPEGKATMVPALDASRGLVNRYRYLRKKATEMDVAGKKRQVVQVTITLATKTKGRTIEIQCYVAPETGAPVAMVSSGLTYMPRDGKAAAEKPARKGPGPSDRVAEMMAALMLNDRKAYLGCFDVLAYLESKIKVGEGAFGNAERDELRANYRKNPDKMQRDFASQSFESVRDYRHQMPKKAEEWKPQCREQVDGDKAKVTIMFGKTPLTYLLTYSKRRWLITGRER